MGSICLGRDWNNRDIGYGVDRAALDLRYLLALCDGNEK